MSEPQNTKDEDLHSAIARVSHGVSKQNQRLVAEFFNLTQISDPIDPRHDVKGSYSDLIGGVLKVVSIERGKISCLLDVKPPILNGYGGMHGGAVGSVAARVATACARTVVAKDRDLFLGELSICYISAAPHKAELIVDGSVVKSGRNITFVTVDFRLKESNRLAFMTRATFFNKPYSSL